MSSKAIKTYCLPILHLVPNENTGITQDYILNRSDDRGNTIKKLYEIDFLIFDLIKELSKPEKERLLKHLELDNSLKISSVI